MSPPKNKRKKPFRVRMTRIWGIIIISIKDLGVGSQIPLGQVLGTAKQRGSLWPTFVPPSMEHSLGWLSRAGIFEAFASDLLWGYTGDSGISMLRRCLLDSIWSCVLPCSFSGNWVVWAQSVWPYQTPVFLSSFFFNNFKFFFPPCHFVSQFYV